ncbi:MAG: aromatic ring-hydroxylating oxygenase subunit alpha [Planctomycetaceae bacterium]
MSFSKVSSDVRQRARTLAAEWRDGYTLDQPFYTDVGIFELDLEQIFWRHWLLAGHVSRIPHPGDYFLYEIAGESIIVVRDKQNQIHANYNVCTHRGSRICDEHTGHALALICPYHAWTFNLDGSLRGARAMPDDFDRSQHGLRTCPVKIHHGMIYIYPGDGEPPEFDAVLAETDPFLAAHELEHAKLCRRMTWEINANWKLVLENFAECYHCGPSHPEYCSVMAHGMPLSTGVQKDLDELEAQTREWEEATRVKGHFTGSLKPLASTLTAASRIPIGSGHLSQSRDGRQIAPLMGRFRENDGGLTSTRIHPGGYVIAPCDYAIINRFTPLAVDRTLQEILWLVHPDAVEGVDYDPEEVVFLWRVTSDEDLTIIEANQQGVNSRAYRPGCYSKSEDGPNRLVKWYLHELTDER